MTGWTSKIGDGLFDRKTGICQEKEKRTLREEGTSSNLFINAVKGL